MSNNKKIIHFIEIGPLMEQNFSGIPKVICEIANYFLTKDDVFFFIGDVIIPNQIVEKIIQTKNPTYLNIALSDLGSLYCLNKKLYEFRKETKVGIFPNIITCSAFDFTVLIAHDISYITESNTHSKDTIKFHSKAIYKDVKVCDLFLCVSKSTAEDVQLYLGVDSKKIKVITIGSEMPINFRVPAELLRKARPFALYIGTIEPRKNIELIFKALKKRKSLLNNMDFLICGRDGWLVNFDQLIEKYDLNKEKKEGKILRRNFVSEEEKWLMIQQAKMLIYPSTFEGFGLPVAEALEAGTNIITSNTSSLVEASSNSSKCIHINPYKEDDLIKAIEKFLNKKTITQDRYSFSWFEYVKKIELTIKETI